MTSTTTSTTPSASDQQEQTVPPVTAIPAGENLGDLLDLQRLQQVLEPLASLAAAQLLLHDENGQLLADTGPIADAPAGSATHHQIPVSDPATSETFGRLTVHPRGPGSPAGLRLISLIAGQIGQIAAHERDARQRLAELTAVYNTSMVLAESRDLANILSRTVRLVAEVLGVKAASIRLIDEARDELRTTSAWGLSEFYLKNTPLRLSLAEIDHAAFTKGHEQVLDLRGDPRVQYPAMLESEGLISMLSVPLRYQGQSIGVLRAYTDEPHYFSNAEVNLMKAVAAQAGAAIVNTRLAEESAEAEALEKQVLVAADVQQRMVPVHPPACRDLEFASAYIPCFELAGDLFDFIPLGGDRVGVVIADVAGKGVPASLIMATVRAYLRATSEHLEDPAETIRRLNVMLCHDTLPGEFVSLFYGIFDGAARTMDYVLAGHIPPLLLRDGEAVAIAATDMILGVLPEATYTSKRLELRPGDRLLIYTDGLDEARNFKEELYGHHRVRQSLLQPAQDAEMMVQNIIWDMRRFVGLRRKTDDVTVIAVRVS